jgi:two-component system, response regulator RegA
MAPPRLPISLIPSVNREEFAAFRSIAATGEAVKLGAFNDLSRLADVDDLLLAFTRGPGEASQVTEDFQPPSLARAEWEHIQRVLTDCGGNISEAARRLGLHRRSLQRKLQKYPPAQ